MSRKYRDIKDKAIENIDEARKTSEAWIFWDRYMRVLFAGDISNLQFRDRQRLRVDLKFKLDSIHQNLAGHAKAGDIEAIKKAEHSRRKCQTLLAEISIVEGQPPPDDVYADAYPRLRIIALENEALLSILERESTAEHYQSLRDRVAAKVNEQLASLGILPQ